MQVTIIVDDELVLVEGQPNKVDLSSLDPEIHAIQWDGSRGEIEYRTDETGNRKMNFCIVDFTPYQHIVDLWIEEAKKPLPSIPVQPKPDAEGRTMHVIAN